MDQSQPAGPAAPGAEQSARPQTSAGPENRGRAELLTNADADDDIDDGTSEATYRYHAYGNLDPAGTTGLDEDDADETNTNDTESVNPYRFNSKRFDPATDKYDMGFRTYDPGLNRYLTRDNYNGALNDLALGTDPWNTNRYAFAGGNPISRVELDGHITLDGGGGGGEREREPNSTEILTDILGGGGQGYSGTAPQSSVTSNEVDRGFVGEDPGLGFVGVPFAVSAETAVAAEAAAASRAFAWKALRAGGGLFLLNELLAGR